MNQVRSWDGYVNGHSAPPSTVTAAGHSEQSDGYSFTAPLWEWESRTSWFFLSLPEADADDIDERYGRSAAGFGSIRVEATIGDTSWRTSIFPSTTESTYVLPVKKAVRSAERIEVGAAVTVHLTVLID